MGVDSPQIELSDEFMLALYKTLREDISEHEVEFLQISENDSMELLGKDSPLSKLRHSKSH